MECPNCGNSLDTSSSQDYVRCEYCRSVIAVMSFADELLSTVELPEIPEDKINQIKTMLATANIDLENSNYEDAYIAYEKILSDEPLVWEAIVNQAICVFWMGRQDMKHMKKVVSLLEKAKKLSNNNEIVIRAKRDIAHNLAVIASNAEMYGDYIPWSLECFNISKSLVDSDEKRDEVIMDYSIACLGKISDSLQRGLSRDKKEFDPPMSDIRILCEFIELIRNKENEFIKLAVVLTNQKLEKHKNIEELQYYADKVKSIYSSIYPDEPFPKLIFPRFGNPKIE